MSAHWQLDEVEPTDVLVIWPEAESPTLVEVEALLNQTVEGGVEAVDEFELDDADDSIEWSAVLRFGARSTHVIVWLEQFDPESLDLSETADGDYRWVIGLETPLDRDDPIGDYAMLMRAIARTFPEAPAALDVNTTTWLNRAELDRLFTETDLDPPPELLWVIHAVAPEDSDRADSGLWVHSHGLHRCGLPELEILEVPADHTNEAARLINAIAELMFEAELPAPGEAFSPGPDIEVVVQPWKEVARHVAEGVPGSTADRMTGDSDFDEAHAGLRAAIVAPEPQGAYKAIWAPPREALRKLHEQEAVLFRSQRATERAAGMARRTWPEFAMAFARAKAGGRIGRGKSQAQFLVKAAFAEEADSIDSNDAQDATHAREHVWFLISEVTGDRARGELLNQPVRIPSISRGDELWIERDDISDWTVFTPLGVFEPDDCAGLEGAVERLHDENDDQSSR